MPSIKTINLIVWSISLAMQAGLLLILYRRGLMRRFPIFTLLLGFYVVRSVALFALSGHLDRDTLNALYDFLSLADVALQLGVAAEIVVALLGGRGEWTGKRTMSTVAAIAVWIAAAGAGAALLPAHGRVPIDRGLAFTAFIMILLWLWMAVTRKGGTGRRIADGFAIYGAVAVGGNLERGFAAMHRNTRAYMTGSYAPSVVYLAVLLFWMLMLKPPAPQAPRHARTKARGGGLTAARGQRA